MVEAVRRKNKGKMALFLNQPGSRNGSCFSGFLEERKSSEGDHKEGNRLTTMSNLKTIQGEYELTKKEHPHKTSLVAVACFVGFVVTVIIGTLELGMDVKSITMIVTFVATQIALIQPSSLPFPSCPDPALLCSKSCLPCLFLALIQPSSLPFLALVGRPWSMLAGACFMILLSDLSSEEAFKAIDLNTLALLFGASLISANLEACQIQRNLIDALMKDPSEKICLKLSLIAAAMALIITNDGSSLIVSPVALKLLQKRPELPRLPIMLAVSSAANIGSALFLSGNPQNILVSLFSKESGLTFTGYMLWAAIPTVISMVINSLMLLFLLKNGYPFLCCCMNAPTTAMAGQGTPLLEGQDTENPPMIQSVSHASLNASPSVGALPTTEKEALQLKRYRYMLICSSIAMIVIFFIPQIEVEIGWVTTATAILGAAELLALVDYELLLMFTGLFVVTGGMTNTGVLDKVWAAVQPGDIFNPEKIVDQSVFTVFVTLLSNSVGNVPAVLLLQNAMGDSTNPKMAWQLLAWISTLAGNLTLLGSAANVIVAAAAQKAGISVILSNAGYLKFGLLSTCICIGVGLIWTNIQLLVSGSAVSDVSN
eukprot:g12472.t1